MMRRLLAGVLFILAAAALALYALAPPSLINQAPNPRIEGNLATWLEDQESRAGKDTPLIPETGKRLRWYQGIENRRTRYSIVYLHGFSATRQEIAPVNEMVADGLQANLFETRLAGHGQQHNALEGVRAEDWLEDAAEALTIGAKIGEKVVVMGTSTGATLALAMVGHPAFGAVSDIILLSPNFAPRDQNAEYLTWPGGLQLAYLVAGSTRSWTAQNDLQARFWSTNYPMEAAVEMMRLVKFVRNRLPLSLEQSLLVIYSPSDQVVDVDWIYRGFEQIGSPHKQLVEIAESGDRSNHVLAGAVLAPENNELIAGAIRDFILESQASEP